MVDDEIAAQIFQPPGASHHIFASQVVAHHLHAEIAARLHDAADRLLVSPGHDHDVRRAGLGHHLGFQVAAIHRFQVGDDRRLRKSLAQCPHAVHALGDNQRRSGLQPVNARTQRHLGRGNCFVDRDNIQ